MDPINLSPNKVKFRLPSNNQGGISTHQGQRQTLEKLSGGQLLINCHPEFPRRWGGRQGAYGWPPWRKTMLGVNLNNYELLSNMRSCMWFIRLSPVSMIFSHSSHEKYLQSALCICHCRYLCLLLCLCHCLFWIVKSPHHPAHQYSCPGRARNGKTSKDRKKKPGGGSW